MGFRTSRGSGFALEPHNSACPEFCTDFSRVEPPGFGRVGLTRAQRVELADFPW